MIKYAMLDNVLQKWLHFDKILQILQSSYIFLGKFHWNALKTKFYQLIVSLQTR